MMLPGTVIVQHNTLQAYFMCPSLPPRASSPSVWRFRGDSLEDSRLGDGVTLPSVSARYRQPGETLTLRGDDSGS